MFDIYHLEKYKENNRIEAKKALGGLPHSLWETYSAFANTQGGVILLGVEESKDKSLFAIDLPDRDKLIKEFWDIVNNTNKVSVNILSSRNIEKIEVDGKRIIAITVPKAERFDKPIYIGDNPYTGTYRRNGEGDYRCTKEEIQAMIRDASQKSQDMLVLENMDMSVLDNESIRSYRIRMQNYRPGHVWEDLNTEDFLYKLGAAGRGQDGKFHPTLAGLVMFGYEYEIVKECPNYFLDYQERMDANTRWTDRVISTSGEWSGNVYSFYFRVYNKLIQDIKVPFAMSGGDRIDDTPIHKALREALANCLINADYYGRQGIVIIKGREKITFSNPGNFRIDIEEAKSGGVSDPRNNTLIKMFNLIDIGERSGSGIPKILVAWTSQGWQMPELTETIEPDRVTLTLSIKSEYAPINAPINAPIKLTETEKEILTAIEANSQITYNEIAQLLSKDISTIKRAIQKLKDKGLLLRIGSNKDGSWKVLK